MTLDEALSCVGQGWSNLIRRYYLSISLIQSEATVSKIEIRSGMLVIKALADDPIVQDMLDRLSRTYERSSAQICEVCGNRAFRRKDLPQIVCLCHIHYVELLNNLSERERNVF